MLAKTTRLLQLALVFAAQLPTAALAQEAYVGGFGHNLNLGISAHSKEHGADVEIGFRTPPLVETRLIQLRGYFQGSFNSDHETNFGSLGLALRFKLPRGFYVQPGLGGAAQTGDDHPYQFRPDRLSLGSRFLFQPELSVGVPLGRRFAAEVAYVHISNAGLSHQNPGMDDVGLRLVYRFPH